MKPASTVTASLWLRIVQVAWVILAVIKVGLFVWSVTSFSLEAGKLCTAPLQDCRDRQLATPQDAASLKADGISLEQYALVEIAYRVVITFSFGGIGLLIFLRKRDDPAALLTAFFLICFGTNGGFNGLLAYQNPQATLIFNLIQFPTFVLLPIFFYSFPSGKVAPRALWLVIILWSVLFLISFIFPGMLESNTWFDWVSTIAWLSIFISGAISQVYRYFRLSNAIQRTQTKWVVCGIVAFVLITIVITSLPGVDKFTNIRALYSLTQILILVPSNLSLCIIPITIGMAILRYRLWDIDVLIRRTLVYSILTGVLAVTYLGAVTLLQSLFTTVSGQQSPAALVISTLLTAALVSPLRRRIQDFIDRRFYRRKYDAEQALAAFAAAARKETELKVLTGQITGTVNQALQPVQICLWLAKPEERKL